MFENYADWTISSQDPLTWVRFRDYRKHISGFDMEVSRVLRNIYISWEKGGIFAI